MAAYIIIFSYYLFFICGLFYLIRANGSRYRNEGTEVKNRQKIESGKLKNSIIFRFNLLAEKIGKILSCIYRNSKQKKINEALNILGSEKKFVINFNAFLGYKIIILFLCITVGGFIGVNALTSISMGMIGGVVGFFIPDFLLKRYNNRRLEDLNKDLPYIIDLLYIATLSGQNIYNSIKILIEKYDGSICLELERFLKDIDYGMGKIKAYRNIMARNNTEDFKNLLFLLMQAEKYGSSMSEVLKQKSNYMKFEISQNVERKARKVTLMMLFPLVFLILPSFIILVGGPLIFSVGGDFLLF